MDSRQITAHDQCRTGLALGGGAARGWAHIGVINQLASMGIVPDVICGCSIGAIVGAASLTGRLDKLEAWVSRFGRRDILGFLGPNLSFSGFVDEKRMRAFMEECVCDADQLIEDLPHTFATVATDLDNGREIWFTQGSLTEAVWASMSLPGLFPPMRHKGRWLVDGGLVNPVPVSVCRALGCDTVIAVNLSDSLSGKGKQCSSESGNPTDEGDYSLREDLTPESNADDNGTTNSMLDSLGKNIRNYSSSLFANGTNGNDKIASPPKVFDAIAGSIVITQDRITRSRMAGEPPDITLSPVLSGIGLLEFFRADEAIAEGKSCVKRMSPVIHHAMGGMDDQV